MLDLIGGFLVVFEMVMGQHRRCSGVVWEINRRVGLAGVGIAIAATIQDHAMCTSPVRRLRQSCPARFRIVAGLIKLNLCPLG